MKSIWCLAFILGLCACDTALGQTDWTEIDTGFEGGISGVHFLDAETGWILGRDATLVKTTDGGESWHTIQLDPNWVLRDVHFFDASFGYLLVDSESGGGLLRSNDGGEKWELLSEFSETPFNLFFLNRELGWVTLGTALVLARTRDGGSTFEEIDLELSQAVIFNVYFATPDTGWVTGFRPILQRTYDGGDSWFYQPPLGDPEDGMHSIFGLGDRVWVGGTRVGDDKTMFMYSWDRGETWTIEEIHGPGDVNVESIYFTTLDEGWRLIGEGTERGLDETVRPEFFVEHTTDGGMTWQDRELVHSGPTYLRELSVTERHVWAVGGRDIVLRADRAGVVGVETEEVPITTRLDQNYPNPYDPMNGRGTSIGFTLAQAGPVKLTIFDLLGRPVATLVDSRLSAGRHTRTWTPSTPMTSGLYVYRLESPSGDFSKILSIVN